MISIQFRSEALEPDAFQILEFDGEEEISHLFRFELHLVSRDPDIDFQAVLESSAVLEITTQGNTRYVHGMLCEFEQGGEWHSGLNEYRAVLVPRLWMLTQSQQNQIFQDQTVAEIIENELVELSNKGGHPLVESGLGVADYEIYTNRDYYEREYVVQYKETDFNFISRLMEHEGIFYFFENDEEREKVVITDAMDVDGVSEQCTAEFNKDAAAALYDRSVVYKLSRKQKQIPGTVLMKDYNYRSPDLPMQSEGDVTLEGIEGIGFVTEFGAHFKSPEEGEELAAIRAEEYRCQQNIYTGEGNNASFFCGGLFSLEQHFRTDYNQDYLLTRLVHHGKQDIESWGNVGGTTYYNQFSCIPSGLQYRPQRLTPKPRMYGIMNGIIDSEQDMGRADIDEEGRYKVLMPFDISGVGPGKASRRIRMSQPYGGGGTGMSFPLIKGTEVIWTCIDGDIDRPIITGTVPNPLNPSVTNTENNTSNVIKTTSGITMGFHDGSGGGASQGVAGGGGSLPEQNHNQSINTQIQTPQVNQNQVTESPTLTISSELTNRSKQRPLEYQQQMMAYDLGTGNAYSSTGEGKQFVIAVPDYGGTLSDDAGCTNDSYLRLGVATENQTYGDKNVAIGGGWYDYTDGDRVSITQGEKIEYINGGNYSLNIASGALMESDASQMWHDSFTDVGGGIWRRFTVDWTSSSHITFGDSEEIFGGATFDGFIGLATGVTLGGSLSASLGAAVEYKRGVDFSFGAALSNDTQDDRLEVSTLTHQMTAGGRMRINVNPTRAAASSATNKASIATVAALGAAATATAAGVPVILELTGDRKDVGKTAANSSALAAGYGLATALQTLGVARGFKEVGSSKADGGEVAELDIKAVPPGVRLGMGAETGPPVPCVSGPGIDISPAAIKIGFGGANQIVITPNGITIITPKITFNSASSITAVGSGPVKITGADVDITGSASAKMAAPNIKSVFATSIWG